MPAPKQKRVLVVEDEKAYSRALVLKLQHAGYEAHSVANGEEALAVFTKEKFDLVLLDLVMPRLNGFSVLEEMRKRSIGTPVIVLSNLSQDDDEKKARELGARDFLGKSNTPIASVIVKVDSVFNT